MTTRSRLPLRFGRSWRRLLGPDGVNVLRRHAEMRADQAWAMTAALLRRGFGPAAPVREPRFALVTVNFSTTRYLKLMLLTLSEQGGLGLIERVVVVDNRSRDGGLAFLRNLDQRVARLHLVEHRYFLNHARGMRGGVRALDRLYRNTAEDDRPNLLLFCDADVVFRNPDTVSELGRTAVETGAALIGEARRRGGNQPPDIQASFFVVPRDVYRHKDTAPLVNHGSPASWLEQSIWRAGLPIVDFPTNHGGYALHRGRTGVAAARAHLPHHSYATVSNRHPHFMGVPDGAGIWAPLEARYSGLLEPSAEDRLLDVLAGRLSALGTHESAPTPD